MAAARAVEATAVGEMVAVMAVGVAMVWVTVAVLQRAPRIGCVFSLNVHSGLLPVTL